MAEQISPFLFNLLGDRFTKQQMRQSLSSTSPTITVDDINAGYKTRYFAKYTTQRDGTIYELSGAQYASIEDSSIFQKTTINWIIRGALQDTVLTLKDGTTILVKGVISKNKSLVTVANDNLPGLVRHLQNYMEFWSGE